jgi:hypothetical protein
MGVIFKPIPNQFLLGYFRFAGWTVRTGPIRFKRVGH